MKKRARAFHAATAISAAAGVIIAMFAAGASELDKTLTYFTELSSIIVAVVAFILVINSERESKLFAALRLDSLICIIITAAVYHLLLASQDHPEGWAIVSNFLLHTVTPVLTIVGWAAFGPRNLFPAGTILKAVVIPIVWLVLTLIRGAFDDYYPYDFMNVVKLGYLQALVNVAVIVALFIGLCFAAQAVDKRLDRRASN